MENSYRIITDGAGQELVAQLGALLEMITNGTTTTVATYTSKAPLTEETGRNVANKIASIYTALKTYIAPSAKKLNNTLTIGTTTFDGSANRTVVAATQSAAGLLSASDKKKLDGVETGATKIRVKGNAESTYRTGDVNITPANVGLGNVNNTSDVNKPVSTAQQAALDLKENKSNLKALAYKDSLAKADVGLANVDNVKQYSASNPNFNTANPVMDGTASPGSAITYARSDHKHPTDTSRAAASHTHLAATTSTAGFMSADDKTKLNGLSAYQAGQGLSLSGNTFSLKTLDDMSWGEISAISQAGKAASIFHVGQEKKISLSTGESVTVVILGFNHDDLYGGGKAGITFGLKNCLKTFYDMNNANTNSGGWTSSAMRTRMAIFKRFLPLDLQSVIRAVSKNTSAGEQSTTINSTSDDLFLFSHIEVFGTIYYNHESTFSVIGEGKQYEYYKGNTWISSYSKITANCFGESMLYSSNMYYQENSHKGLGDTGASAFHWWLRSPDTRSPFGFCFISTNGNITSGVASGSAGVCFGFCV